VSRFSASDSVSGSSLAKSSVARNIKKSICESYPPLDAPENSDADGHLDRILGDKKQPLHVIKCHDHVNLIAINKAPKFFQIHADEQWLPILRLLHQFPDLLPVVQVDRGAIKFVLKVRRTAAVCGSLSSAAYSCRFWSELTLPFVVHFFHTCVVVVCRVLTSWLPV
jgi:PUA domain protein